MTRKLLPARWTRTALRLEALEDRANPAPVSWDGGGDNLTWTNRFNWSGDVLPGSADDVTIDVGTGLVQYSDGTTIIKSLSSTRPLTVSFGTLAVTGAATVKATVTVQSSSTLTLNGPASVLNLTQTSGTANGAGALTISGTWSLAGSGTMAGTGRTTLTGTATLTGTLNGRTVDNAGTATVNVGSTLSFTGAAVWNNLPAGTFNLPDSAGLSGTSVAAFNNAGTFRKTGPVGIANVTVPFNNTGTTQVQLGTLGLNGGGTNSGTFNLDAGTVLAFNGTYTFAAGGSATGAGTVQPGTSFGTLTATGDSSVANLVLNGNAKVQASAGATLTVGTLTFLNGTLAGDGAVAVTGNLNWTSGTMSGTGATNLTGTTTIGGFGTRVVNGRTVNNSGTATVAAGNTLGLSGAAVWNNLASGTFVLPDSARVDAVLPSTAVFNNAGTVIKDAPPSFTAAAFNVPFHNTGTVRAVTGGLALNGGGTNAGTFDIAAGAAVGITRPYTFLAGATTIGTGFLDVPNFGVALTVDGAASVANLRVIGGTVTVNAALTVQSMLLNNIPSLVTGPGALTVTGPLTWAGGTMGGTGVTNLAGTTTISNMPARLDTRTVNNSGTATVSVFGGNLQFFGTAVWNNLAGGTFVAEDSVQVMRFTDAGAFNNAGTIRHGSPPGLATFLVPVTNTGLIVADAGDLNFAAGLTQTAGTTTVAAGWAVLVPFPDGFRLAGGELTGLGRVSGAVVNTGGTVRPGLGGAGELLILGDYTQKAGGTLAADIGGVDPGSQYDRLTVAGAATLGGTLAVTTAGYLPDFGDEFDVVTAGARSGEFDTLTGVDLGSYRLLVPEYGPTYARLVTVSTNVAPVLDPIPDQTVDEGGFVGFTATATGPEPTETITYSLDPGAPAGAAIDPVSGAFTFAPDDGPVTYTITVRATDDGLPAKSSTQTFTVTVNNVAPTAGVAGPADGVRGQTRTVTLLATDPSSTDRAAGFAFAVDWGDGTAETVTGPSGLTLDHVYADAGAYTVRVTAADKDGGASDPAELPVSIGIVQLQGDTLAVGGSTGKDSIGASWAKGGAVVTVNDVAYGPFAGVGRIVAFGQAGDDVITLAGNVNVPTELYGDGGNDDLRGGTGDDVLDGGAGDDTLHPGAGRDILIGGAGSDHLFGQGGDDLLIAGDFMPAARFGDRRSDLLAVQAGWTGPGSYSDRVAALDTFLGVRVTDDGVTDHLVGGTGLDWFFARTTGPAADRLAGLDPAEVVHELP